MDLFGDTAGEIDDTDLDGDPEGVDPPEPEQGLLHPRSMTLCLGHEKIEAQLLELFNSKRMPHGLVFSGPKGIGKATLAYRLARFILKHGQADVSQDTLFPSDLTPATTLDVGQDEPVFRRVASGGHPDIFTIERNYDAAKNRLKSGVEVADIRKVAPFLRMKASSGGWRVVIIDDADTMNRNAQNALLKILEEPPENTLLILVTHRAGALIPTIKSRTRRIDFTPLNDRQIKEILHKYDPHIGAGDADMLCTLAEGSAGRAIQFAQEGGVVMFSRIASSLENFPDMEWAALHSMADELSRPGQEQAYESFCKVMLWQFSRMAKMKAIGEYPGNSSLGTGFYDRILKNSSLARLLEICEKLQEHFNRSHAANLDKRQTVLGAFSLIGSGE